MTTYVAPVQDMRFVIEELADLSTLRRLPAFEEVTSDLVEVVLDEGARLAGEVLAPLNKIGDLQGSVIKDGQVHVAEGFAGAYATFVEAGWPGVKFSPDIGGQGLPSLVAGALEEMWQSANMALALCPMLTQGAIDAIELHGSDEQKATYLEKMVSGEWTGTMNLTEAQAGSDLAAVRTRAVPEGDHYLVTGQKIFITWGDHDVTENIVHLVLARTPDAPEGVKGISLFIVPKYLPGADGGIGKRNDVRPISVEHKLGIHASPTCVMGFGDKDGAVGYLVGEEGQGLVYMFTMMNRARIAVGMQGLSIADRAYQQAKQYARDRIQGTASGHAGRVSIIHHADVRRMLMTMKSAVEAMRAVLYTTVVSVDVAENTDNGETRAHRQARVDLMTPIVKGWCTELAQEVASLGVQIHGGMGFIEETGAAQHFRDARITTIYEGTTGIQAMDLVGRKTLRDDGAAQRALLADMRETSTALGRVEDLADVKSSLDSGIDAHQRALDWLLEHGNTDMHAAGSVAFAMLMLTGTVCGGWQMARAAIAAERQLRDGVGDAEFQRTKLVTARFYLKHLMPRAQAYLHEVLAGSEEVMALAEEQF